MRIYNLKLNYWQRFMKALKLVRWPIKTPR